MHVTKKKLMISDTIALSPIRRITFQSSKPDTGPRKLPPNIYPDCRVWLHTNLTSKDNKCGPYVSGYSTKCSRCKMSFVVHCISLIKPDIPYLTDLSLLLV